MTHENFSYRIEASGVLLNCGPVAFKSIFQFYANITQRGLTLEQSVFSASGPSPGGMRFWIEEYPTESLNELLRLRREIKRVVEEFLNDSFGRVLHCEIVRDTLPALAGLLDAGDPFALDLLKAYRSRCESAEAPGPYE